MGCGATTSDSSSATYQKPFEHAGSQSVTASCTNASLVDSTSTRSRPIYQHTQYVLSALAHALLLGLLLPPLQCACAIGLRRMSGTVAPLSTTERSTWKPHLTVLEVEHREQNGLPVQRADIELLIKDGLAQDLLEWRDKKLTMKEHYTALVKAAPLVEQNSIMRQVLIWDNKLYWPDQPACKDVHACCKCSWYFEWFEEAFNKHWGKAAKWPNVLFLFNVGDYPACATTAYNATLEAQRRQQGKPPAPPGDRMCIAGSCLQCPAPIASVVKMWPSHIPDILVPYPLRDMDYPFYNFPWRHKEPRALFRGEIRCSHHNRFGLCSRLFMAALSHFNYTQLADPEAPLPVDGTTPLTIGDVIDVGLTAGFGYADGEDEAIRVHQANPRFYLPDKLPRASRRAIKDHSRYKFVLALDGITASNRLAKLMHTNSVVLKEQSPYIEWFYRSLEENKHYLPIWVDNATDTINIVVKRGGPRHRESPPLPQNSSSKGAVSASTEKAPWGKGEAAADADAHVPLTSEDRHLKEVAENAQRFASRYTGSSARMRYFIEALTAIRDLFPDMDEYVHQNVLPRVLEAMPKGNLTDQRAKRRVA